MLKYFLLCLVLLISACSSNPKIELQPLPIAATEKLPVHVALILDTEFRNFQYTGPLLAYSANEPLEGTESIKLHYSLGELNADLFNQVANNLFVQVSAFDSREALEASGMTFDGIMVPKVSSFNAWQQNLGFGAGITAKLAYKIILYNGNHQIILDWTVESNQANCINTNFCESSKKTAIVLAMRRDIAAQIISQFPNLPEINAWKESIATHP